MSHVVCPECGERVIDNRCACAQHLDDTRFVLPEGGLTEARLSLYSEVAGKNVPTPQRQRRDKLLAWLREMGPQTISELTRLAATIYPGRVRDVHIAGTDLRELERYGLIRSSGFPKQWSAR